MSSPDIRLSQRQALVQEALRLRLALQSVHARINQLTPIFTLPSEILLYIFCISSFIDKPRSSTLGWIQTTTHVCQLWRHIALESGTLWSKVCTDIGADWAAEMFRRARSAPVDISMNKVKFAVDDFLFEHLQSPDNMRNVRTLNLVGPSRLIEGLCTPAPSLETLYFNSRRSELGVTEDSENLAILPAQLFATHAPRLQRAKFIDCRIPWESPVFQQSLVSLTVIIPRHNPDASPSASQLYEQLKRMPLLEELNLRNILPKASSNLTLRPDDSALQLSRLKLLSLGGPVPDILQILAMLVFPSTTSLKFICQPSPNQDPSLTDMIPVLVGQVNCPSHASLPINEIRITQQKQSRILTVSLSMAIPVIGHPESEPGLHNVFTLKSSIRGPSPAIDFLTKLFQQLGPHRISDSLSLDYSGGGREMIRDLVWGRLYWEMRNVRRLEVSNICATTSSGLKLRQSLVRNSLLPLDITRCVNPDLGYSHSQLLWEPGTPELSQGVHHTIFPALQTVILSNVQFDLECFAVIFFENVTRDMEWRMQWGCPIEELVIRDRDGSVEDLLRLANVNAAREKLEGVVKKLVIISGDNDEEL